MFVGHAFLAFGVIALLAARLGDRVGVDPERRVSLVGRSICVAIALGIVAALAASLPDLDVLQAVAVVAIGHTEGPLIDQLRAASRATHRLTTHSLVLATPIAAGIALWTRQRWLGSVALLGLVVAVALASGAVAAAVLGAVVIGAAGIGRLAARWALDARATGAAAFVGLAIHPFTDLFTGTPPAIAAPLGLTVLDARIAPFVDPFANLLLATGAELVAIWVGVGVAAWLSERSVRDLIHPVAVVGIGFAPVRAVLDTPSVDDAVPFVATLLVVGLIGTVAVELVDRRSTGVVRPLCTGLATITVGTVAAALAMAIL
ncbi:metal-dependent hydrolase [Halococcoides cellulosivorans]|uniref:Metal-dependent hydrolase n=1 Tax=Halococcoides cellulosivorans TaxID=1679096 RepID=A0A2R4X178_9EURY|nr:metal-dependent hydrolase [Halococcoides cellulosivorans]AWB27493.1 metal-dependent hydrolase [Halococcoides cellulosivorans]